MHHHPAVEVGETLVDVVGGDVKIHSDFAG
jgi:hypothetical protein